MGKLDNSKLTPLAYYYAENRTCSTSIFVNFKQTFQIIRNLVTGFYRHFKVRITHIYLLFLNICTLSISCWSTQNLD